MGIGNFSKDRSNFRIGSFEKDFEDKGINYIVKDPEQYEGQEMVISGGGDSALDWAIYFAEKNGQLKRLVAHANNCPKKKIK